MNEEEAKEAILDAKYILSHLDFMSRQSYHLLKRDSLVNSTPPSQERSLSPQERSEIAQGFSARVSEDITRR